MNLAAQDRKCAGGVEIGVAALQMAGLNQSLADCLGKPQLDLMVSDLTNPMSAWGMYSAFDPLRNNNPNYCSGNPFGNAVLSRQPLTAAGGDHNLTDATSIQSIQCWNTVVGASPAGGFSTAVCTTHLNQPSNWSQAQTDDASAWANSHASGEALVLGGDFNQPPTASNGLNSAMADLYYSNGTGNFQEVDQCAGSARSVSIPGCNRVTVPENNKLDYILMKQAYAKSFGAYAPLNINNGGNVYSDHYMLIGTATLCSSSSC